MKLSNVSIREATGLICRHRLAVSGADDVGGLTIRMLAGLRRRRRMIGDAGLETHLQWVSPGM